MNARVISNADGEVYVKLDDAIGSILLLVGNHPDLKRNTIVTGEAQHFARGRLFVQVGGSSFKPPLAIS